MLARIADRTINRIGKPLRWNRRTVSATLKPMVNNPLSTWLGFLASAAAPKSAMTPLELDGYLTGIVVAPELLLPSQWIPGLWGHDEPIFDSDDQMQTVLEAVMAHYNDLAAAIDDAFEKLEEERICVYRPLFLPAADKPAHDIVRVWARGFGKAMALTPGAWASLMEDERMHILIAPFIGFLENYPMDAFGTIEDIDELLDESAAAIPRMIVALRKLAQAGHRQTHVERPIKTGRNDPCPCGSGRKYKRCCGAN